MRGGSKFDASDEQQDVMLQDNFDNLPHMRLDQEGTEEGFDKLAAFLVLVGLLVVLVVVCSLGWIYRSVTT